MPVKRRPINFAALRSIPPIRVLRLHGWHPVISCGDAHRGPCPYPECNCKHPRIFRLGPQLGRCFRCGRWGDALALHAHLRRMPTYEAALDLCERLSLEVPYI